jgi:IS605 OrfB family transposase
MTTPVERTKLVDIGGCASALPSFNNCPQIGGRRESQKKVDMAFFPAEFSNGAAHTGSNNRKSLSKKKQVPKNLPSKLCAKDDVRTEVLDTVTCCIKVPVPDSLRTVLDALVPRARICVERMLSHRDRSSSKYYPEIPCVIAKSLIAKYQRNRKCKQVRHLVLPICGDKGRQIKLENTGLRVPALFEKEILPVVWLRLPVGFIRSAEFFQRRGEWYAAVCYNARAERLFLANGTVGVDRNSVGAVATLADPLTGKVLHLGFDPARTKEVWRGRKTKLQSLGKKRLLHKIRNKQSRRVKYENHVVSKQIVDYAAKHRRCIVVEKLEKVRKGKIRRYAEKSQWSFYQLLQFILYKAALRGVMVIEADPAYTSQECSRCHKLSKPNGKSFRCGYCGHNDHRDANAAFSLSQRVMPIGGVALESESQRSAFLVMPFLGTEVQQCA